jgi:nitrate reductase / nitrite oxidoreductase, beta subunit
MTGPVYEGKTLFEAAPDGEPVLGYLPDDEDWAYPNVGEDDSFSRTSGRTGRVLHLAARPVDVLPAAHLQPLHLCPACLGRCPRQSIYKRPEDGIVLNDLHRCRGYRECVKGCPYKKMHFNP